MHSYHISNNNALRKGEEGLYLIKKGLGDRGEKDREKQTGRRSKEKESTNIYIPIPVSIVTYNRSNIGSRTC